MSRSKSRRTARRRAGEPNPLIVCRCGCGEKFRRFDAVGRPRSYVSGHNRVRAASPCRDLVIDALRSGTGDPASIAIDVGLSLSAVRWHLTALKADGLAEALTRGVWALTPQVKSGSDLTGSVRATPLDTPSTQRTRIKNARQAPGAR